MDLLIIGLDGLSYNMLDRFDVSFPYLERVRDQGVSGDLMSVDTPTTVPAWTSFATGKDPGTHGVTNMNRVSTDYEYGPPETNTDDPAVYDLVKDAIFINLPASAGRVATAEGSLVQSSILEAEKHRMTPEPLQQLDSFDDYVPYHDEAKKKRPNVYQDHVREIVASRHQFAEEAFETYDPRVGFVLFSATDWAGHILSNLADKTKRAEFYRTITEAVADATEQLSDLSPNVLLMSDHGFEHKHTNIHLANWLHDQGMLSIQPDSATESPVNNVVNTVVGGGVSVAQTLAAQSETLYDLFRLAHNRFMGTELGDRIDRAAAPNVDYADSIAWQLRYACLYLNDDRFVNPQVTGSEREQLREELINELSELTADGDPIFRDVLRPEEVYADPASDVPDVIPRPAPGYFPITHWSPTGGYTSRTDNFEHRYRGIVAADGPLFANGCVEGMSIVDLLPTLMTALGEPLSPTFDGTVRTELLAEPAKPTYLDSAQLPTPRSRNESTEERDDREEVVAERLADLGYME
jgi:predicted AlkP superfamily phosphohydrolase/phosphomutase